MSRFASAGRRSLLYATLSLGVLLAVPATSSALEGYYNCVLKPSNQWCDGQANGSYDGLHSWDFNEGWYPGLWNGTVTACQRLYKPSDGTTLAGNSCSANWTWNSYGTQTCICLRAEVKQISGGNHSINGRAVAN